MLAESGVDSSDQLPNGCFRLPYSYLKRVMIKNRGVVVASYVHYHRLNRRSMGLDKIL